MVKIRAATIADTSSLAFVDVETWRSAYAGILPTDMLVALSAQQREASWRRSLYKHPGDTLVAVTDDFSIVGFVSGGPNRDLAKRFTAQVYTLYVLPDFQGRDIGRRLLISMFQRLIDQGHRSALIWVVAENPARFFYERLGGKKVGTKRIAMGIGTIIDTFGYGWEDLTGIVANQGRIQSQIADDSSSS